MSETATKWLITGGIVLVVVVYRVLVSRGERRRAEHFDLLASALGATVDRQDGSARFVVTAGERDVEVSDAYRGGGMGAGGHGARYVSIATPLRGRSWDLHSVEIRPRFRLGSSARPFEERFAVEEFGLPMRKGWLTADVVSSLEAFFAVADSYGRISIEGGSLVNRVVGSPQRLSVETLRSLAGLLVRLAASIERAS